MVASTITTIIVFFICAGILLRERKKVVRLTNLVTINNRISGKLTLPELMKEITQITKREMSCLTCNLYFVDFETNELWYENSVRIKMGFGMAGWVAEHGRTLNVRDSSKYSKQNNECSTATRQSVLTVPILRNEKTIAVLQVIRPLMGMAFSKKDEELLVNISRTLAIAIENSQLYNEALEILRESVSALAGAIDAKDTYTQGHSKRVAEISLVIGKQLEFSESELGKLEIMAQLHDVGKISIPDKILNKQGSLSSEEYEIMKTHITSGQKILSSSKRLKKLADGAAYHHEKFDGTGYMKGLAGEDIPLNARIIAVADTFDAITSNRPYSEGKTNAFAITELEKESGSHFDPQVVSALKTGLGL